MLSIPDASDIVAKTVSAAMKGARLSRVMTDDYVGYDGRDMLEVTVVFDDETDIFDGDSEPRGDRIANMILAVNEKLQLAGEERFAFFRFATERELRVEPDDLDDYGDPKS